MKKGTVFYSDLKQSQNHKHGTNIEIFPSYNINSKAVYHNNYKGFIEIYYTLCQL